ncbi:transmembrane 4 L6 family member 20-like isoform X2 [Heptranchias perlo]|uniref:transmembrane 4 L6 family member 20-like isoform X2 n=1 Tax=Heptranchias perlo TaxID=212740 RepID=UPI00355A6147
MSLRVPVVFYCCICKRSGMPCFTLFNGSCLLALTILAIILNMIPLIVDYHDGQLFQNSISCYEWWLPGVFGGGILVIPAVSMSLAARKGQKCNTRTGMLLSALLSLISVIGALYCALVSLHSLVKGPLVCDTASHSLENCNFSIEDIKCFSIGHERKIRRVLFCEPATGTDRDLLVFSAQSIVYPVRKTREKYKMIYKNK